MTPIRKDIKTAYEKSTADAKADRMGAKKSGESVKAWEGSAADKRVDAKAERAIQRKRGK